MSHPVALLHGAVCQKLPAVEIDSHAIRTALSFPPLFIVHYTTESIIASILWHASLQSNAILIEEESHFIEHFHTISKNKNLWAQSEFEIRMKI